MDTNTFHAILYAQIELILVGEKNGHENAWLLLVVPRNLISAFIVRCLDSIIPLDSIAEISSLELAFVAAQAGLCLTWSETLEDTFCHVLARI